MKSNKTNKLTGKNVNKWNYTIAQRAWWFIWCLQKLMKDNIDEKSNTLEKNTETQLNGLIMQSKPNIVEYDEKSKFFASLEKKWSERNRFQEYPLTTQ